jgi:hypothetical protein
MDSIPAFARALFFSRDRGPAVASPPADRDDVAAALQRPGAASTHEAPRPQVNRSEWLAGLAAVSVILFVLPGCRAGAAGAGADPGSPLPPGSALAAVYQLHADVDALDAQVERIATAAPLALAAGEGCREVCEAWGAAGATFAPGSVECRCRRLPSLGKGPKVRRAKVSSSVGPMERAPEERVGSPVRTPEGEPGAAAVEDDRRAGLSFRGGPRS